MQECPDHNNYCCFALSLKDTSLKLHNIFPTFLYFRVEKCIEEKIQEHYQKLFDV